MLFKYLIIINIIAYLICYIDKQKAIHKKKRISEQKLISLSILGGGIGFLLAMHINHHKTKHLKFKIIVPICILLWIIIISIERGIL